MQGQKTNFNNNNKNLHAFNKSNANAASASSKALNESIDREQLSAFSPSHNHSKNNGGAGRYQPQTQNNNSNNEFRVNKFNPPRTTNGNAYNYKNNNNSTNNGENKNLKSYAPQIAGWKKNNDNAPQSIDEGEKIPDLITASEMSKDYHEDDAVVSEASDDNETDDVGSQQKQNQNAASSSSTAVNADAAPTNADADEIYFELEKYKKPIGQNDDNDDDVATERDDDHDDDESKKSKSSTTNNLVRVSSNLLPRKIVFQRARRKDTATLPRGMINLSLAAKDQKEKRQGDDQDDDNVEEEDDDQERDAGDPLFEEPDFVISREDLPPLSWKAVRPVGGGLENLGATCFANAVMQCFAYLPPLSQYLCDSVKSPSGGIGMQQQTQYQGNNNSNNNNNQTIRQIGGAAADWLFTWADTTRTIVNTPTRRAYSPRAVIRGLNNLNSNLRVGQQHDASEFAIALVDKAQIAALRRSGNVTIQNEQTGKCDVSKAVQHTTMLMRLLGGFTRSRVTWGKDEELRSLRKSQDPKIRDRAREIERADPSGSMFRSSSFEEFTVLSLNDLTGQSLDDCLNKFIEADEIEGFSTERKGSVTCLKTVQIHRLPVCLTIMLGRFHMDPMTGRLRKKNKMIRYPNTLNMAPYCSPECLSYGLPDLKVPAEATTTPTTTTNGKARHKIIHSTKYVLCGVVVHLGNSLRGGHYISYIKAPNDTWYECDDETVSVDGKHKYLQQEAFMLFYTIDPTDRYSDQMNLKNLQQQSQSQSAASTANNTSSLKQDAAVKFAQATTKADKKKCAKELKKQQQQEHEAELVYSATSTSTATHTNQNNLREGLLTRRDDHLERQVKERHQDMVSMAKRKLAEQHKDEEVGAELDEHDVEKNLLQRAKEMQQQKILQQQEKQKVLNQQQIIKNKAEVAASLHPQRVIAIDHSKNKKGDINTMMMGDDDDNDDSDEEIIDDFNLDSDAAIGNNNNNKFHYSEKEERRKQQQQQPQKKQLLDNNDSKQKIQQQPPTSPVLAMRKKTSDQLRQLAADRKQNQQQQQQQQQQQSASNSSSASSFPLRGAAGSELQIQSSKYVEMMNIQNNNEDDDQENYYQQQEEDPTSPLYKPRGNKNNNDNNNIQSQQQQQGPFSPSSNTVKIVKPEISLKKQISNVIRGKDQQNQQEQTTNNNNHFDPEPSQVEKQRIVILGQEAAQILRMQKQNKILNIGTYADDEVNNNNNINEGNNSYPSQNNGDKQRPALRDRVGHMGKFAKGSRDEEYQNAMDAPRQKKFRRDMVRARDANLFASGTGPNRFQKTAEEKRSRSEMEFSAENYYSSSQNGGNNNHNSSNDNNNNNRRGFDDQKNAKQYKYER